MAFNCYFRAFLGKRKLYLLVSKYNLWVLMERITQIDYPGIQWVQSQAVAEISVYLKKI